jgi:beta-xylosidase
MPTGVQELARKNSQTPSPAMMGRNNGQTMIATAEGNARTQFQSKSSDSRFTTSAIANPTHSTTKITMAYVLSTRGTETLQNDESLIVTVLGLQYRQPH